AHAGRKASTAVPWKGRGKVAEQDGGWVPVAPSAVAFADNYPMPVELDVSGIRKVITDFTVAAERAHRAGFQVAEIHAAHGCLLHQCVSPCTNRRRAGYGGSFEDRLRPLLEGIQGVQMVWPAELPRLVRNSATEWAEGG